MVLGIFAKVAEERIREAIERGELDNVPGMGKPLKLEDDSRIPEELRLAYKILKNAGFAPPELGVRAELMQVEDLLVNAPDEKARYKALKRYNYLTMKLSALRPGSALLEEHRYTTRIIERICTKPLGAKR